MHNSTEASFTVYLSLPIRYTGRGLPSIFNRQYFSTCTAFCLAVIAFGMLTAKGCVGEIVVINASRR